MFEVSEQGQGKVDMHKVAFFRGVTGEINPPKFTMGRSDSPKGRKSTKSGKHSASSGRRSNQKLRTTNVQTKAHPITSGQTYMSQTNGKRKQSDSMNPNEDNATGKCLYKKSSTCLNDKETKQSTSKQNVGSPENSVFKKEDSPELPTPEKISETQATSKARYHSRARSNSPSPSLKRKHDGETEREVKEKIQKKKRKLVDN
ncbi:uncharacterized protein LOC115967452 isoform X1 [Quercus lobata]|uniref:uncharacterized protein LOC115967452 isoform X1 n=1 Tax=Quercus lobata TaxID=97700 RepID=UPI001243D99B|nr:uncharacterized protein LOC115967452 isoform X1 [Quercus lobata]XP_030942408.1 uncharacterized protein LOC115967452 isoform X1 [Quercus lobata]XP_030942409.1 uncharacterized protein LOC115967452 isoform X1 [Quercus lobata]XP_030942410.1 uncharacterized protein LOC115967452 isoform X1 [Quercus lobata]XP_030942411.1 uncharacterized protein LOC115967452 isoform X1 [Quercus lobata]